MKASTNRDVTIGQDWSPELIYWDEPGECNFSLPISHFRVVNSSYPRCVKAFKTTMELCVTEELAKWGFVGRINWLFGVEILVGCIVTKRNTEYCQHKGITCLCAQRTRDVKILSIHLNHFYAQHFLSHTRCRSEDVHHWSRCAGWPQLTGKCLIRSLRYQGIAASGPGWRLFQWRGRNWSEEIQNVSLEGSFNKTWEKKTEQTHRNLPHHDRSHDWSLDHPPEGSVLICIPASDEGGWGGGQYISIITQHALLHFLSTLGKTQWHTICQSSGHLQSIGGRGERVRVEWGI